MNGSSATQQNMQVLKDDVARLTGEVKTLLSDSVKLPRDAMLGDLEASVREKPIRYLAYALGVGVVLGMILR